jgi:hypothetical protein
MPCSTFLGQGNSPTKSLDFYPCNYAQLGRHIPCRNSGQLQHLPLAPFNLHNDRVRRASGFLLTAFSNARPILCSAPHYSPRARLRKSTSVTRLESTGRGNPRSAENSAELPRPRCSCSKAPQLRDRRTRMASYSLRLTDQSSPCMGRKLFL